MAIITVYKSSHSTQINDFDLNAYKRMGWSTSPSSSSPSSKKSSSAPTPSSNNAPKTSSSSPPSGATLLRSTAQLKGLSESQIWRDPNSNKIYKLGGGSSSPTPSTVSTPKPTSAPAPTPAKTSLPSSSTPPAGATLLRSTAQLRELDESQLWRDPNSSKIYKLSGSTAAPQQESLKTPEPKTQAPPTATKEVPSSLKTAGLAEANARRSAGTASSADIANLEYAESKGWTPSSKPSSEAPAPESTPAPETSGSLNTAGLLEADARRRAGTASDTDIANLEYAESKGWTPSGIKKEDITLLPAKVGAGDIPGLDTVGEIPGLNTKGLAEAYARKVAGTANATDLENLAYAESKGWKPNGDLSSPVTEAETANDIINAQQDADIAAKEDGDEITTRSSVEEIMDKVRETILPDEEAPEAPGYEESLRELRTEYGIDPLETNLNSLNDELQGLYAQRAERIQAEKDKTVATNVIAGRVSEVERNENERIAALERSISNVTNQLNTKYSVVNSMMSAKELDYKTAVQAYDAEMSQNIGLFNAAQGIQDDLKTEEQRALDSARSSAQILVNGYMGAGMTFDDLTDAQKTQVTQLSLESGFGDGFYETVMSVTAEVQKDVLTHVISDDKAYATIIYKDGTTATIPTGQPRGSNVPAGGSGGGGGSSTSKEDKEYQAFLKDSAEMIGDLDSGEIGWGTAWDQMHTLYPNASPQLIDETLKGGYDPSNPNANDQGYYGRGTISAEKESGLTIGG